MKIFSALVISLAMFAAYVANRPGGYQIVRSTQINASPEKIFPYLSRLSLLSKWNPYEKIDLQMKKSYSGRDGEPGSMMSFEGNLSAGSGRIELLQMIPNQVVILKLTMTSPLSFENYIEFRVTPESSGATHFAWSTSGTDSFLMKLLNVFFNRQKIIVDQMQEGFSDLKFVISNH